MCDSVAIHVRTCDFILHVLEVATVLLVLQLVGQTHLSQWCLRSCSHLTADSDAFTSLYLHLWVVKISLQKFFPTKSVSILSAWCSAYSSDTDDEEYLHCKGHLLRTPHYCWCDRNAMELFNKVRMVFTRFIQVWVYVDLEYCCGYHSRARAWLEERTQGQELIQCSVLLQKHCIPVLKYRKQVAS